MLSRIIRLPLLPFTFTSQVISAIIKSCQRDTAESRKKRERVKVFFENNQYDKAALDLTFLTDNGDLHATGLLGFCHYYGYGIDIAKLLSNSVIVKTLGLTIDETSMSSRQGLFKYLEHDVNSIPRTARPQLLTSAAYSCLRLAISPSFGSPEECKQLVQPFIDKKVIKSQLENFLGPILFAVDKGQFDPAKGEPAQDYKKRMSEYKKAIFPYLQDYKGQTALQNAVRAYPHLKKNPQRVNRDILEALGLLIKKVKEKGDALKFEYVAPDDRTLQAPRKMGGMRLLQS